MFSHLLVAAGFLAASFPALAQTAQPMGSANPAAPPSQQQAVITQQEDSQVRVYRLVGSKAIGADGQAIGKVDDLLLDRDQKMVAVIVSVGGFLGMGSKSVALPAGRGGISQGYRDERVAQGDARKEELIAGPAFKATDVEQGEA